MTLLCLCRRRKVASRVVRPIHSMLQGGLRTLLLALTVCLTQPLAAHRLNLTTTDIVWQAQDGALEVTHSMHLDDALTLLARLGNTSGTLDLATSARLMNYLNKRFQLITAASAVALEPYGAHIDGGVLYLYQRATVRSLPPALEVTNNLLHDMVDGVQNQVNWRVGEIVRSSTTARDDPIVWLTLNSTQERNSNE